MTAVHPGWIRPIRLLCMLFAASLALAVTGCGDDGGGEGADDESADTAGPDETADEQLEPQSGGKLVFGIDAESDGYNPVTNRFAQAGHLVASAVYDPLATLDEEGQAVPYLAESIEPNQDSTRWTITLPEGVTFHNGEPLTAEGVAEVFEAHKTGLVTAPIMQPVESIEVAGDLEVTFTVVQPWSTFPLMLTSQVGYVMAPSMLTDPMSAAEPVGTGPFVFQNWERGTSWTGARNTDYWRTDEDGTPLPYLDEIEFVVYRDALERNDALENGDIDLLFTLTPQAITDLQAGDFAVEVYDRGDEDLVALNTEDPPFDNIHARRALAHATDQEAFLSQVQQDVYAGATSPFAPEQLGHREETGYPEYDPQKATEELEKYFEETGEQQLAFTYTTADDVDNIGAAQFLTDMWAEVGINATIDSMPQSEVILTAVTGQYQAIDWRNWAMPDPDGDYHWWHSSGVRPRDEGISVNVARFGDDQIDEALDAARASTDPDERDELYARVAERFGEMVPYLWLGRVGWAIAGADTVHGWEVALENGTVATVGPKTWVSQLWLE